MMTLKVIQGNLYNNTSAVLLRDVWRWQSDG